MFHSLLICTHCLSSSALRLNIADCPNKFNLSQRSDISNALKANGVTANNLLIFFLGLIIRIDLRKSSPFSILLIRTVVLNLLFWFKSHYNLFRSLLSRYIFVLRSIVQVTDFFQVFLLRIAWFLCIFRYIINFCNL